MVKRKRIQDRMKLEIERIERGVNSFHFDFHAYISGLSGNDDRDRSTLNQLCRMSDADTYGVRTQRINFDVDKFPDELSVFAHLQPILEEWNANNQD